MLKNKRSIHSGPAVEFVVRGMSRCAHDATSSEQTAGTLYGPGSDVQLAAVLRPESMARASFFPRVLRAEIAGKCFARGRTAPASQL
jgi:hypothetical protein